MEFSGRLPISVGDLPAIVDLKYIKRQISQLFKGMLHDMFIDPFVQAVPGTPHPGRAFVAGLSKFLFE